MGTWCRSCRGPMSSSPEVRKIKTSNSQPSQTNQTHPCTQTSLPTRPDPSTKNHLVVEAWLENWSTAGSRLLQTNDPEKNLYVVGFAWYDHTPHSANFALNFVNFHLRLVFICTWTWWCWQHLAGLGRWRGTQARSCLRHSPTGSPSRTCSSASFKANCSLTTQWAARLKHAHQHLFEKQSSSQSLKN